MGSSVLCHYDNESVVVIIKGGYCKDPSLAHMLRCLFFLEAKFDVVLTAAHVPEVENGVADSTSRNNVHTFFNRLQCSSIKGYLSAVRRLQIIIKRVWGQLLGVHFKRN